MEILISRIKSIFLRSIVRTPEPEIEKSQMQRDFAICKGVIKQFFTFSSPNYSPTRHTSIAATERSS